MLQVATLLLLHKIIKYSLGTFLDEALSWMLGYKLRLETRSESLQSWGRKVDSVEELPKYIITSWDK